MIYSFHIFDKSCEQVYVKHLQPAAPSSGSTLAGADHAKLLFGVLSSLRSIATKLGGGDGDNDDTGTLAYRTDSVRVEARHTPSGLWFVLVSGLRQAPLPAGLLETIYGMLYVPFVVMNPLSLEVLYPTVVEDEPTDKRERRRRAERLARETQLGYGGRDNVRGLRMVQDNVLFDAALTRFLEGL